MASYRVCFMNQFARNRTVYRICQRAVVIRCAHTRARAIEAAKKRFARLERIRDWRIHASEIEVEMIEADPRIQTGCVNWPPGIGNSPSEPETRRFGRPDCAWPKTSKPKLSDWSWAHRCASRPE